MCTSASNRLWGWNTNTHTKDTSEEKDSLSLTVPMTNIDGLVAVTHMHAHISKHLRA